MKESFLIEGLVRRDKLVFEYIFNYYYSSLCTFAMRSLNDRNLSEDIVQDFFVSLWMEASDLRIRSALKCYLFTSIKNRCIDYHKHQKVIGKYLNYSLLKTQPDENLTDLHLAESELRQAIQKSMEKLSPRCREIFELSRLDGLSNQEISKKLKISKRTVEVQISNSLKIIRKELVEYLPFWLVVMMLG